VSFADGIEETACARMWRQEYARQLENGLSAGCKKTVWDFWEDNACTVDFRMIV
jgi:hypothetical protein